MEKYASAPTPDILSALVEIVVYNWEVEKDDFEENRSENHIFQSLLVVRQWLQESNFIKKVEDLLTW